MFKNPKVTMGGGSELRQVLSKVRDGCIGELSAPLIGLLAHLGYLVLLDGAPALTLKSYRLLRERLR
ncbi:hypothetical protein [Pseudomonas citronellolis]|uniref:hypothetical protein n=1 Tax=Pseudomonas citronellolis TaxID=53408 RepID=UPI0023E36628|nr:hypothetical protein [Pseudomonas citronellolis]MDF3932837.1 hypothetical protein [Pseudomonas citronellolis]